MAGNGPILSFEDEEKLPLVKLPVSMGTGVCPGTSILAMGRLCGIDDEVLIDLIFDIADEPVDGVDVLCDDCNGLLM